MTAFQASYFLCLEWQALKPITHVTHFQGALWSAMLRHAANDVVRPGEAYHDLGIGLEPADFGVAAYAQGDVMQLGVRVPKTEAMRFGRMLIGLLRHSDTHGQFEPGATVQLRRVYCRISGNPWPGPGCHVVTPAEIRRAAGALAASDTVDCLWRAPLRLTKPWGQKRDGRYATPQFFRESPAAPAHLARTMGLTRLQLDPAGCVGAWLDVHYGRRTKPTELGGFVGRLRFRGEPDPTDRAALLAASLTGIGKNRAFGFGIFDLPGRDRLLGIQPLRSNQPKDAPQPRRRRIRIPISLDNRQPTQNQNAVTEQIQPMPR